MWSASIPFLLILLGLTVLVGAVIWVHDWWHGDDPAALRCACGHPVGLHKLSDDVNALEPCYACPCPHWATEDAERAFLRPLPYRHEVKEAEPLFDGHAFDDELRKLLDGAL